MLRHCKTTNAAFLHYCAPQTPTFPNTIEATTGHHDNTWGIRPSLTEVENLFWKSYTISWLILLHKARETSIGPIRKKVDPAISKFEIAMEGRKIKMCKSLQMGLESCGIIIGFQIWSKNLYRITFDPLFGNQTVENWQDSLFR